MSSLLFFASEKPLKELPNPHERTLSINETLALGVVFPDYILNSDFDRDKPNTILYMDREIHINADTKEIEDGDFDDDFSIRPFSPMEVFGIHTENPFCAELCWHKYTSGRAENVLSYIRKHLQTAKELELWHVWLDDSETPIFKRKTIPFSALTIETLKEIEEVPLTPVPLVHYCYTIKK